MAAWHPRPQAPRSGSAAVAALAITLGLTFAVSGCVVAPPVARTPMPARAPAAAPMYFYPERGQDAAQQDRDRYERYRWAVNQSGVDPGTTPLALETTSVPQPAPRDGADVAAGAVTGSVLGASVSSPRHAAGHAVLGAIFGAALGAIAQESRAQAQEQAQAAQWRAQQAAARAPLSDFRRAMGACMAGRGYRIG